jgi:hypothetical protein
VLNLIEVLQDIPGYEGIYKASSLGYITNGKHKLKTYKINSGYLCLKLHNAKGRASVLLHRMIALTFIPNPNALKQINHKDGNKLNNSVDNLEWVSCLQNRHHAAENQLWVYNLPTLGIKKGNTSKYRNVTWDVSRNKWKAAVMHDKKVLGQKRFDLEIDAAKHVDYLIELHNLNRPKNFS